jgi:hypothetical protein
VGYEAMPFCRSMITRAVLASSGVMAMVSVLGRCD